jgi:hypothetical protein
MASSNKVAWQYTDQNGNKFVARASKAITDQKTAGLAVKVGGVAKDGTEICALPRGYKPRRVSVRSASGVLRYVVCYDVNAPLWTTPNETVTLETAGADVVFTRVDTIAERRPKIISDAI